MMPVARRSHNPRLRRSRLDVVQRRIRLLKVSNATRQRNSGAKSPMPSKKLQAVVFSHSLGPRADIRWVRPAFTRRLPRPPSRERKNANIKIGMPPPVLGIPLLVGFESILRKKVFTQLVRAAVPLCPHLVRLRINSGIATGDRDFRFVP